MAHEISFPFPFMPYDVQTNFMKNLYSVLDSGKIGIFESPTGTGKSLSIICGTLKWLKDVQEKRKKDLEELINEKVDDSECDWFNDFLKLQEKNHAILDAKNQYSFLIEHEKKISEIRQAHKEKKLKNITQKSVLSIKKPRFNDLDEDSENQIEDEFAVEDVENEKNEEEEVPEKQNILKIYFASRTHSQLAQFLSEIKKSPFKDNITVTVLGSRANMCINDSISKFKGVSLINEHCIELQRKKSNKKCPFIKNTMNLEYGILSSVSDIEEIVSMGRELKCCPYYATRKTVSDVELVVLPYNILLHKPTRDAYGISVKDNVVIIDEAHNLLEALNNMYSAEISGLCLEQSLIQLEVYYRNYSGRLSQRNVKFIKILIFALKSLIDCLKKGTSNQTNEVTSKMLSYNDFISFANIGNVNLFELVEYCEISLIGHKLHGFTAARVAKGISPFDDKKTNEPVKNPTLEFLMQIKKTKNPIKEEKPVSEHNSSIQYKPSAFFTFIEFLKTLTFPTQDGKILICQAAVPQKSFLKFVHLNPSSHVSDIINKARSVVLAGGTMQPVSEFTNFFINAGVNRERLHYFSCGHVIPPENLLAFGLAKGPGGNVLDFTYKSRKLPETVKELGCVLLNFCNFIPSGIVCFFPSYDYEEFIFNELTKSKVLDSIAKKKKIFREPRLSSDVDKVLLDYNKSISLSKGNRPNCVNGAILFSIVGGKMSEGINFSDDLGRCVIMVGLPYPNKYSTELKEKMVYFSRLGLSQGIKNAGDIYYNNLCMKAVNQSIGRAIRHQNDYACIVLLDYRYKTPVVKDSLPGWILKSFNFFETFGTAFFACRKFFSSRNKP